MTGLRRMLAPLTAIWLCCQIGTVALVPVALWISATDPHAAECECGHGVGAMCPMHHKPTGRTSCAIQSASHSGIAVLMSVAGVAGPMPEQTLSIRPPASSIVLRLTGVHIAGERPVPPDPPPPRA
jgi:hypothetical protein